jgi:hypothetical protein
MIDDEVEMQLEHVPNEMSASLARFKTLCGHARGAYITPCPVPAAEAALSLASCDFTAIERCKAGTRDLLAEICHSSERLRLHAEGAGIKHNSQFRDTFKS